MRRRGQVRIGESIAVVIVFFFMLMFGYSFYIKMEQRGLYEQMKENSEKEALQVAQKIYYMPELQCSRGTNLVRESCYDLLKIKEFQKLLGVDEQSPSPDQKANREYYYDILKISKVEFYPVFPDAYDLDPTANPSFLVYDLSEAAEVQKMNSKETVNMPISLYDPDTKTYKFGYLVVSIFYRSLAT